MELHLVDDLPPLVIPDGVEIVQARVGQDLTRDEWLALRIGGIGGSDVSAIVGVNTFRSPFDVWVDKVADDVDWVERPPDDAFKIVWDGVEMGFPSEAAFMGVLLEDIVCRRFAARTGYVVVDPGIMLVDHRSDYPRIANPDRLYWDPELEMWLPFEAKTASAWKAADWDDGPADHAHAQLVHYCLCLDLDRGTAGALIGGQRFVPQQVIVSPQLAEDIEEIEREFWTDHVVPRQPPPMEPVDAELGPDVLRIGLDEVDASDEVLPAFDRLVEAHALSQQAEKTKKAATAELKVLLASTTASPVAFFLDGKKLAGWGAEPEAKLVMTSEAQARFAADHPDLWKKYATEKLDARRMNPNYKHARAKAILEAVAKAAEAEQPALEAAS